MVDDSPGLACLGKRGGESSMRKTVVGRVPAVIRDSLRNHREGGELHVRWS